MSEGPLDKDPASSEIDLASRLTDEYKILQDKLDKIGAFRFTIKGWSVTVIIAAIFAGSATRSVPSWLWAISLIGFLAGFYLFEKQQIDLGYRFGQRLLEIEGVMSRLLRDKARRSRSDAVLDGFVTLHFVPGIGHHLRDRRKKRRMRPWSRWRSYLKADAIFYLAQTVIVLAFLFWRGDVQTRDPSNFGVVINALPGNSADSQNSNHLIQAQVPSNEKKSGQSLVGNNGKESKKKEEHPSH